MAFPQDALQISVWFLIDGAFVNFTRLSDECYVLGIEGRNAVEITYGKTSPSGGRPAPATMSFKMIDNEGLLNDENPLSPYYHKITKYTEVRVIVGGEVRASMELDSITPVTTKFNTVLTITCVGVTHRYTQGRRFKNPIRSVAYRTIMAASNDPYRKEYWALEEGTDATRFEALDGAIQPSVAGTINLGAYTGYKVSERMATFNSSDAQLYLTVRDYDESAGLHKFISFWKFPPAGTLADNTQLIRLYTNADVGADIWELIYGTGGTLRITAYNAPNPAVVDTTGAFAFDVDGGDFLISFELEQSGANVVVRLSVSGPGYNHNGFVLPDTFNSITIGRVTNAVIGQSSISGCSVGHVAFANDITSAFSNFGVQASGAAGVKAFDREPAWYRADRLALEEGIALLADGEFADTELMSPQTTQPPMEQIWRAVETDGGLLYEDRELNCVVIRSRLNLSNQVPELQIDYGQLEGLHQPGPENSDRRNDVTAKRDGGSSERFIIPDGDDWHFTTEDPPAGMGPVKVEIGPQVYTDEQLIHQAAWSAHQGSWRGHRLPVMNVNMARPTVISDTELVTSLKAMVPGDLAWLTIPDGTPRWWPTLDMFPLILGYTEKLGQFQREIKTYNTYGEAWDTDVPVSDYSVLTRAVSAVDTTFRIATNRGPDWKEGTFNLGVQIDGDASRVTSITTGTPAIVASGAAAVGNNASVAPAIPAGMSDGQLMILVAAIRNSGTGTPNTPTNWIYLAGAENLRIFYRYYESGDAAPTVSFAGGAANATTYARITGFNNLTHAYGGRSYSSPTFWEQLNGSAANISYPANEGHRIGASFIVLWKQNETQGVSTVSGFTEAYDDFTTTGDDMGVCLQYRIDSSPANVTAGSVTTVNASAAISRALVFTLRKMQYLNVDRDVNDSATTHVFNSAVDVWRPAVNSI